MNISFDFGALGKFTKKMEHFVSEVPRTIQGQIDEHGQILYDAIRKNASGRPGPQIITGRYYNSFMIVRGHYSVKITNPSPQTRRLEYGFVGVDSLGRKYHQPAFPHFRPALAQVGPMFTKSLVPAIKLAWRTS